MASNSTKEIVTIVGARPQFVKAAVVSRAIADKSAFTEKLIHTGQHFDPQMSQVFFDELDMPPPDYNFGIHSLNHGAMTGQTLEHIESVLVELKPDGVLVYGDTNATLAGALAAAKIHIPVFHIEAGLRSYNRAMPEEVNRVVTDHLSTALFCPTRTSVENLEKEGITSGVYQVGDVMFDATLFAKQKAGTVSKILSNLNLENKSFAVTTVHRAENTDGAERFQQICSFLKEQAAERLIVFPLHPRTRKLYGDQLEKIENMMLIDPVGYFDMHALLEAADLVITDSGGLQKEAYFHSTPCITLRDETEWTETVLSGWNRLWTQHDYAPRNPISDYGDGKSGEGIVDLIAQII